MLYKKKEAPVEAFRWFPDVPLPEWAHKKCMAILCYEKNQVNCYDEQGKVGEIVLVPGKMFWYLRLHVGPDGHEERAMPGDYVVHDPEFGVYSLPPDIFEREYTIVAEC